MTGEVRPPSGKRRGHERTDLGLRAVLIFGAALVATAAVILVALWILFDVLAARSERADRKDSFFRPAGQFPAPRLMLREGEGLGELRDRERVLLDTYGWVDRKEGIVRVPVERALQEVLEKGLPARGGTAPPAIPGEKRP